MRRIIFALILAFTVLGFTAAHADFSFSVGTRNFYLNVGDYDYLPYAYATDPSFAPPQVSFYGALQQYGAWVNFAPFGQVWRPYATAGWRPYYYGHWIYTSYGPTWEAYEPWGWIAYHYGNWVFSPQLGWVWIPGYDWHPGRVEWAQGYDTVGWMPMPPAGYDYSRGYLSYVGPQNQFAYQDGDFGFDINSGYSYGGPYYDPRYRDLYYNSGYNNVNFNLWVFIGGSDFDRDDYSNYALGPDYTRYIFDRRLVRVTSRQPDRTVLQRITRQDIPEVPVEVHQLQTDKQAVRVVVPKSSTEIQKVREHSKDVVREAIAPAFAEKQKQFKGQTARNKTVDKIFNQENATPDVEKVNSTQFIQEAQQEKQTRERGRDAREQEQKQKVVQGEQQGKIRGPKNQPENQKPERTQDLQKTPGQQQPSAVDQGQSMDQQQRQSEQQRQNEIRKQQQQEQQLQLQKEQERRRQEQQQLQQQQQQRQEPPVRKPDQRVPQPKQPYPPEQPQNPQQAPPNQRPPGQENPNPDNSGNVNPDQPDQQQQESSDQVKEEPAQQQDQQTDKPHKKSKPKKEKQDEQPPPQKPPEKR